MHSADYELPAVMAPNCSLLSVGIVVIAVLLNLLLHHRPPIIAKVTTVSLLRSQYRTYEREYLIVDRCAISLALDGSYLRSYILLILMIVSPGEPLI